MADWWDGFWVGAGFGLFTGTAGTTLLGLLWLFSD